MTAKNSLIILATVSTKGSNIDVYPPIKTEGI